MWLTLTIFPLAMAQRQPQSATGNTADSLQTDLEFFAYLSGIVHMQDYGIAMRLINGNGWKSARVVHAEGANLSYTYNGKRRITIFRTTNDTVRISQILLYDIEQASLYAIQQNLSMLGYKYESKKLEERQSVLPTHHYTNEKFFFTDKQHFPAIIMRDTYTTPPSESYSVIFSIPNYPK